jgi:citrate lyase subunit beta/citryl-CoA lyase
MLANALTRGADAVIVDLEDGVPIGAKNAARDAAATWISDNSDDAADLWVRLNPSPDLLASDLDAVVRSGLRGVYLPKASAATDIAGASHMIDELEDTRGLRPGSIGIVPLLETGESILEIPAIAASPRVLHMALGETDLAADLGMHPSHDGRELNPIRVSLVVASAAKGLNPPIGPVQTAFKDLESLRTTSVMLRRMGYGGRAAIHPNQIPIINESFLPTQEEIVSARDVLERFESAEDAGAALTVAKDGSLIDEAVVRRARVTLAGPIRNEGK